MDLLRRVLVRGEDISIRTSPTAADVRPLVREATAAGFRRIVAAGGDGTVNAVASELIDHARDVECGILPVGTGNDLALSLGIPLDLERAAAVLRWGTARPVDAIHAISPDAWGLNAVVAGFGGRIADRLTPGLKRRWRALAYLRAALPEIGELRSHAVRIEIDGTTHELDLFMLVIANGRHTGGGIPLAPGATTDDGKLDVIGIRSASMRRVARLVPAALGGRHLPDPLVFHVKGRSLRIVAGPGFHYNLDGESWTRGSTSYELVPEALRFVRP